MANAQRQMFEKQREATRQVLEKEFKIKKQEKDTVEKDLKFLDHLSKPKAKEDEDSHSDAD